MCGVARQKYWSVGRRLAATSAIPMCKLERDDQFHGINAIESPQLT